MANDHVKMFTEEYAPIAERVSKQTGIAPSVLLAQWGMESKYGRSPVGQFNFGNIKDLSGAGNEGVDNKTKSKDKYLNFETPEDFGDYYAHMMRRLYPKTLNAGTDITKYTEGLRNGVKGSYFEDPNYEDAIRGAYKVTSNFYSGTGDAPKEDNPNNPFAVGVPLADKARESSTTEEITPTEPTTLLEKASALANEINPALAGAVGAVTNVAGSRFVKPPLTPAEIESLSAEKKLELSRQALQKAAPSGTTDLEESFQKSQAELERLRNEQKLAQARIKGMPKAPPAMEVPAPSSPFPQVVREGRASGPKVEGDSGTRNWMIQEAGQQHQLPETILDMATGKSKDTPTGGKALIDKDLANLEKIKQLGAGDYGLVTTEGGVQLQLPPTTVAERQADIDRQAQANQAEIAQRAEQTRLQQEAQAQQFEQQRLANEAELARVSQERARIGQQHNATTSELKDIKPLQKAVTQAEQAAELAKYKAKLKAQNQPMTPQDLLNKGKTVSRPLVGGLAGAAGVMSLQEALERYKAGDTSEGVLKTIQASSAAAMLIPPVGKNTSRLRKAGALGAIGSYGYDFGRGLLRDAPPEK
jgi:hypothetical protein